MSLPLEFHPAVRGEVDSGYRWYQRQQPGLGTDFLDTVQALLAQLGANPAGYGFADGDIREAPLRRVPYAIYYRVLANRVRVLAVYHTAPDPSGWQGRAWPG